MTEFQKKFKTYICIDVQTTGLNDNDEIISCGAVNHKGEILLSTLVKPLNKIEWPEAQRIHQLSPELVFQKGIEYNQFIEKIKTIIEFENNLIFYNAAFDQKFFPVDIFEHQMVTCIMESAIPFLQNHPAYANPRSYLKQSALADLLEVNRSDLKKNNALSDAELGRRIWQKMLDESINLDTIIEY